MTSDDTRPNVQTGRKIILRDLSNRTATYRLCSIDVSDYHPYYLLLMRRTKEDKSLTLSKNYATKKENKFSLICGFLEANLCSNNE